MFYGSLDTCQPRGGVHLVGWGQKEEKKKVMTTNKCISSMLLGKFFSCNFKFRKNQKKIKTHLKHLFLKDFKREVL